MPKFTVKVLMQIDKETNNTVRYKEVTEKGRAPKIGTIYVPKATLMEVGNNSIPDAIAVTVTLA